MANEDELLKAASKRTQESLATARQLHAGGFFGPALIWTVRGVEIFFKEFLLTPHFLEQTNHDWQEALREAAKLFGSSSWSRAMVKINEFFGPLDPMLTEGGQDALDYWKKRVVRIRGDVVHGRADADANLSEWAINYAEQLVMQMKLRLIVEKKHPLSETFVDILKETRSSRDRQKHASGSEPIDG